MTNLKSKVKKVAEVDWSYTLQPEQLYVDKQALALHEERIKNVFANQSPEEQQKQLTEIIMRDNLFNLAMTKIMEAYEFELDEEELGQYANNFKEAFKVTDDAKAREVAQKMIQKTLVFDLLQEENNIAISDEELSKILDDYYIKTGKSIRQVKENQEQKEGARKMLLEEKTIAWIIQKFPKNFEKLRENMEKIHAEQVRKAKESSKE